MARYSGRCILGLAGGTVGGVEGEALGQEFGGDPLPLQLVLGAVFTQRADQFGRLYGGLLSLSELSGMKASTLFAYSSGMDELAGFTAEVRKLALDPFRLLQPHLEQNQSLQSVAQTVGIPYRTAHRWLTQYRLFDLAGLTRKKNTTIVASVAPCQQSFSR